MKKLITVAAATAALAMPAMAGTMTISFADEDGNSAVITFDDVSMTATTEGEDGSFDYTWDAEANAICGDPTGEGEVCITFAHTETNIAVGTTSEFTLSTGGSGTATVTAVSE